MMDVKQLLKTTIGKIRMLFTEEEIFYIGGSDVLPPPLEKEQEQKCLVALSDLTTKTKDYSKEDARKMLIEHNLRLVVYLAKKFENTGICVEDLISIGTIGLIKGINTFNPEKKIKLATYASRCIENEILMYLRRNNKIKMEVSIDEPLNVWTGMEMSFYFPIFLAPRKILYTGIWKMKRRYGCCAMLWKSLIQEKKKLSVCAMESTGKMARR